MPTIDLTEEMVPEIERWRRDGTYEVRLIVRQETPTDEGSASFEVLDAAGKRADPSDVREAENLTFHEAKQKAQRERGPDGEESDVLEPAGGETPTRGLEGGPDY